MFLSFFLHLIYRKVKKPSYQNTQEEMRVQNSTHNTGEETQVEHATHKTELEVFVTKLNPDLAIKIKERWIEPEKFFIKSLIGRGTYSLAS